ncbi:MAG: alpha/beta hydrolase [Lachnospiraceae bacterium]|jgi:acetyl esterase/lipase|nr:alpha/beta hydrolase [Lachnospiraceae bacterium]
MVREFIRIVTSERLIGPKIQDGTFRKKVIEPAWHCPDGYASLRLNIKNCDIEILTPPDRNTEMAVLQLHGGGYIGRLKNAYRDFAKFYSDMRGGMRVFTLDYRVAPKHPYPAALKDAYQAYCFMQGLGYRGSQVILAGDSAGGGLALALCGYLRDHGLELPSAAVLMSPWTDLTASGASYEENYTKDPLFGNTRESMIYNGEYYGSHDPADPYISPLFGEFNGFPSMLFQVGSIEMLLSDTTEAVKKARSAGCEVKETIYEGMFHVFQMAMNRMPESEKAWEEVAQFVNGVPEVSV